MNASLNSRCWMPTIDSNDISVWWWAKVWCEKQCDAVGFRSNIFACLKPTNQCNHLLLYHAKCILYCMVSCETTVICMFFFLCWFGVCQAKENVQKAFGCIARNFFGMILRYYSSDPCDSSKPFETKHCWKRNNALCKKLEKWRKKREKKNKCKQSACSPSNSQIVNTKKKTWSNWIFTNVFFLDILFT